MATDLTRTTINDNCKNLSNQNLWKCVPVLDSLDLCNETGTPEVLHDKGMVDRLSALQSIAAKDRDAILYLMDGLIRDAKSRQTYGGQQAG